MNKILSARWKVRGTALKSSTCTKRAWWKSKWNAKWGRNHTRYKLGTTTGENKQEACTFEIFVKSLVRFCAAPFDGKCFWSFPSEVQNMGFLGNLFLLYLSLWLIIIFLLWRNSTEICDCIELLNSVKKQSVKPSYRGLSELSICTAKNLGRIPKTGWRIWSRKPCGFLFGTSLSFAWKHLEQKNTCHQLIEDENADAIKEWVNKKKREYLRRKCLTRCRTVVFAAK